MNKLKQPYAFIRANPDGSPAWDSEDCVCQDPVWPLTAEEKEAGIWSQPVYTYSQSPSMLHPLWRPPFRAVLTAGGHAAIIDRDGTIVADVPHRGAPEVSEFAALKMANVLNLAFFPSDA